MQTSFEDVCQMALSEHKSPFDMLQTLVELQMEWDNNGHIKRRIDKAGFPYERELTDFNYSLQPSINQQQINEFASGRFSSSVIFFHLLYRS